MPIQISISCLYTGYKAQMLILTDLGASTLLRFWILMFIWVVARQFQDFFFLKFNFFFENHLWMQKEKAKCVKSLHINNNAIKF
jgi:hypothetical protein